MRDTAVRVTIHGTSNAGFEIEFCLPIKKPNADFLRSDVGTLTLGCVPKVLMCTNLSTFTFCHNAP